MSHSCQQCGGTIDPERSMGICPMCLVGDLFDDGPEESDLDGVWAGPFRIVEKIGEGGFGDVFLAEQSRPVQRTVALKILKSGAANPRSLARFEGERQALASLDHPSIATFFDAGETDDEKLPFFAMELVDGLPLDRYADHHRLGVKDRARLIAQAANAIHHAHLKGIIHRDLKPTNVLVSDPEEEAGEPLLKIIDFGIARATEHILTDSTLLTRNDEVLGTPDYLSPEQAASGGEDVDIRSDVYALGAMLYELLAGQPPLNLARRGVTLIKALGEIHHQEPSNVAATAIENQQPNVPRDLALITTKALAKEREQRYGSAAELAADLNRFLDGEAVTAQAPTALYRLGKLVRRHKLATGATLTALLALVAGTIVSLVMANRAQQASEETSRAFASSDFRRATDAMIGSNEDHAVAFLCRGLRENPNDRVALRQLMLLLVGTDFPQPLAELRIGNGGIVSLAISEDGRTGVVEEAGQKITFFNLRDPTQATRSQILPSRVWNLITIPDADAVAAVTSRHGIHFLDFNTMEHVAPPFATKAMPNSVVPVPSGHQLVLTQGKAVSLIDWRERVTIWKVEHHSDVVSIAVSPDGSLVASLDARGRFRLMETEDGTDASKPRSFTNAGAYVGFTPDGKHCLVGVKSGRAGRGGAMHLIDLAADGEAVAADKVLPIGGEPNSVQIVSDGHALIVPHHDYSAYLWDIVGGRLESRTPIHHDSIMRVGTAVPDGSRLYTGDRSGVIRQFAGLNMHTTGGPIRSGSVCHSLHTTAHGDRLIAQDAKGWVRIWDVSRHCAPPRIFAKRGKVNVAKLDAVGARLACIYSDGWFRIWDTATGAPVLEHEIGYKNVVGDFDWSSGILALGTEDGILKVHRVSGSNLQSELIGEAQFKSRIYIVRVSPEGSVVAGTPRGEVGVFTVDPESRSLIELDRSELNDWITDATWGPNGLLAVGTETGKTGLWRAGRHLFSLANPGGLSRTRKKVIALAFSPNGQRVAALRGEGTVPVWDTSDGELIGTDFTHDAKADHVPQIRDRLAFSGNDLLLTTSCSDNRTRTWNLRTRTKQWEGQSQRYSQRLVGVNPVTSEVTNVAPLTIRDIGTGRPLFHYSRGEFRAGDHPNGLSFSADGNSFAIPAYFGATRVYSLPPYPASSAEPWFLELAEDWAGSRVGSDGDVRIIPIKERLNRKRQLIPADAAPVQRLVAEWLMAPVEDRAVAPGHVATVRQALDVLCGQRHQVASRTALMHRPNDPQAMLNLARELRLYYPYPSVDSMIQFYAQEALRLGSGSIRADAGALLKHMRVKN